MRGHSSIEGALDLAMLIERPSLDADDITLQSTKSRDDRIPPFLLRWLFERDGAGELCESVALFDIYRGSQIPEGKKSCAFALRFRAPDRTLRESEAVAARDASVAVAAERFGAVLRA